MKGKTIITLTLATGLLCGCQGVSGTGNGAMIGGGIGALAGQALGGNTEGTLIGAGAGALLGGLIGNEADHQAEMQRRDRRHNGTTRRESYTTTTRNADGTYTVTGTETTTSEQEEGGYTPLPQ